VQHLVDVDVAEAGQEGLVEQQRLEPPGPPAQGPREPFGREFAAERLWTELG